MQGGLQITKIYDSVLNGCKKETLWLKAMTLAGANVVFWNSRNAPVFALFYCDGQKYINIF